MVGSIEEADLADMIPCPGAASSGFCVAGQLAVLVQVRLGPRLLKVEMSPDAGLDT